jgi:Mn2+/Fe2+ NRAMP family transporter
MATEGTKFQVNFKLADGTLINIYATDSTELETGLATIQDSAALINSVSASLTSAGAVRALAAGLGATPVAAPAQSSVIEEGHCKHGKLVYRTSKPGAPKEWKGWFCPSPQGTPDQCAPKFLR